MLSDESICNSKRFVEIGCGSGAICISLLKQLPSVSVVVSSAYTLLFFAMTSQQNCPLFAQQFECSLKVC